MDYMPTWTCQKCGQRVENFGWGKAPWKSHRCATVAASKEAFPIPAIQAAAPAVIDPFLTSSPSPLQEPACGAPDNPEIAAGPTNSPGAADPSEGFFQKTKRGDLSGFL